MVLSLISLSLVCFSFTPLILDSISLSIKLKLDFFSTKEALNVMKSSPVKSVEQVGHLPES